jgi:hypothetical protein
MSSSPDKLPAWPVPPTQSGPLPSGGGGTSEHLARRPRFRLTPKRVLLIVLGVIVFLAISLLLARWLQTENIERDDDLELIQAEARGNLNGMLDAIAGCRQRPACVASVKAVAADSRVHRPGSVKILQLESPTAYSLTGATGKTRFAWTVLGTLPVVQCIDVRRTGNFLSGVNVSLIGVSPPIENEADC